MPARVTIEIVGGPMTGRSFEFTEHDTFLFGRMADCHACLPDDPAVSRHHFILEVSPPQARLRDLGSLNGTSVNGELFGGRDDEEQPEDAARRQRVQVDIRNGDRIIVGESELLVRAVGPPPTCRWCGGELGPDTQGASEVASSALCPACRLAGHVDDPTIVGSTATARADRPREQTARAGRPKRGDARRPTATWPTGHEPGSDSAAEAQPVRPMPVVPGYELLSAIGVGGFGAVYRARRHADGRVVAVKTMRARTAINEEARRGFQREIDLTRRLAHENIVSLLDSGSSGLTFYFVMELCEGGSLSEHVRRRGGRVPLVEAAPLVLQALEGLACAHSHGIVHRDVKPSNVLLFPAPEGWWVKVSDLGIAKSFEKAGLSGMTLTGALGGTPRFMPREQLTDYKYLKPVSDVWSMAATFYYLLTGSSPREFRPGHDPIAVVLSGRIVPLGERLPGVPVPVADVVDRALADDLGARYRDAAEFREALAASLL